MSAIGIRVVRLLAAEEFLAEEPNSVSPFERLFGRRDQASERRRRMVCCDPRALMTEQSLKVLERGSRPPKPAPELKTYSMCQIPPRSVRPVGLWVPI